MTADLPPSGGDVRQDRGGREGTRPCSGATRFLSAIALIFAICFYPVTAFAHATLISSHPSEGAVVATSTKKLLLTFNEPVSPLVLKLIAPDATATTLDRYTLNDATLAIEVPLLSEGTHVLSWRVVSADGHPIGGSLIFSVGHPSAGGAPTISAGSSLGVAVAIWLDKLALYAGLFLGIGGTFFLTWIVPAQGIRPFVRITLCIGLLAALALVGLQGLDALELPLTDFAEAATWKAGYATSFGSTATVAIAATLAAFAALQMQAKALTRLLSLSALLCVGLALTASGHAADAAPRWLTRPAVFVHAVGITFWVGALAPLGLLVWQGGPAATSALRRFSRWIPLSVILLVAAGCTLSIVQVENFAALASTAYGRLLVAKLGLVALLLALAAWNRWRLTQPAANGEAAARRQLARTVLVEIMLALMIFGIAAAWRFTPPPRVLAIEAAKPARLHIHTSKAMADISIAPGRAGQVAVSVLVMTPAFDPLAAKEVTLSIANQAAGIEPIKVAASPVDGGWRVDALTIPLSGRWTIGLDVLISDFEMAKLRGEMEIRP